MSRSWVKGSCPPPQPSGTFYPSVPSTFLSQTLDESYLPSVFLFKRTYFPLRCDCLMAPSQTPLPGHDIFKEPRLAKGGALPHGGISDTE